MGLINPFTGAVSLQPTRSLGEQVRQSRADSKQLPGDEAVDHVVENPDAIVSISDEHFQQSPGKQDQQKHKDEDETDEKDAPARLDLTA